MNSRTYLAIALALGMLSGCATFRSDLVGAYTQSNDKNQTKSKPVSILFHFTHVEQMLGYDAIPKVVGKMSTTRNFDDVIHDATREISNLGKYTTFTEEASDVNHPERRSLRDSLIGLYDYTIKVRIVKENHFTSQFFAGCVATVSLTIIPVPFKQTYRMETEVFAHDGKLLGTYDRQVSLSKWVEMFLVFAYPFYPDDRKREEAVLVSLHDTFRQIDAERVLVTQ